MLKKVTGTWLATSFAVLNHLARREKCQSPEQLHRY